MNDSTEPIRKIMARDINVQQTTREELERDHGQVWDTHQLGQDFVVKGFMAPFVVVRRKSDNKLGSLTFQHCPRFYFSFVEDK